MRFRHLSTKEGCVALNRERLEIAGHNMHLVEEPVVSPEDGRNDDLVRGEQNKFAPPKQSILLPADVADTELVEILLVSDSPTHRVISAR